MGGIPRGGGRHEARPINVPLHGDQRGVIARPVVAGHVMLFLEICFMDVLPSMLLAWDYGAKRRSL
jgi:hypothetical protein